MSDGIFIIIHFEMFTTFFEWRVKVERDQRVGLENKVIPSYFRDAASLITS